MTYAEIAKKLGKLLNGQDIWFDDHSPYDDIYYETDDSLDIGDYEQDFLGLD